MTQTQSKSNNKKQKTTRKTQNTNNQVRPHETVKYRTPLLSTV